MSSSGSTWYYAARGERLGPHSLGEMRTLVTDGTVSPETLVWTPGLAAWSPASELPILSLPAEPEDAAPPPLPTVATQDEAEPAPLPVAALAWRRFFARWFDTLSLLMVGLFAAGYTTPEELAAMPPLVLLAAPIVAQLIQALCIAATGTTPGKALVGLRIATAQGGHPGLGPVVLRELLVWALGMGMGLNFVMPVTHAFSYYRLTRYGTTPWDERLSLRVQVQEIGPIRSLVIAALMLFAALVVGAGLQMAAGS